MRTSISIPEKLYSKVQHQVKEEGFSSMTEYVLSLIRADVKNVQLPIEGFPQMVQAPSPVLNIPTISFPIQPPYKEVKQEEPRPVPKPVAPPSVRPKVPLRDPNTPDPYLVYGGKCQFKTVNPDNIMCLHSAAKKIAVAKNQNGEMPDHTEFTEAYLCPDHLSHVSHSSGYFVK